MIDTNLTKSLSSCHSGASRNPELNNDVDPDFHRDDGIPGIVRGELYALLLLVPLAAILGFVLLKSFQPAIPMAPTSPAPVVLNTPSAAPGQSAAAVTPLTPVSLMLGPSASAVSQTMSISILGPQGQITVSVPADTTTTVADLMQQAAAAGQLQIKTKNYGGAMGLFLESLNSVANNNDTQLYWTLYVNGKLSDTGMSQTNVAPGDTITWKYENINNSL